jgi:hypothetical protein
MDIESLAKTVLLGKTNTSVENHLPILLKRITFLYQENSNFIVPNDHLWLSKRRYHLPDPHTFDPVICLPSKPPHSIYVRGKNGIDARKKSPSRARLKMQDMFKQYRGVIFSRKHFPGM